MSEECIRYYQTASRLTTKAVEFMSEVIMYPYKMIRLTETWLADGIPSNQYFPPKYNRFGRDRDYNFTGQRYGGGVLAAVERSLKVHRSD